DEQRRARGEKDETQHREQGQHDAHRGLVTWSPGRAPGRLEEGSASDGSSDGRSARKPTASTGACGT
ncbi:MAG TPA: hypothetical protein VN959_02135, partial [Mycobacterium sp.]|nr:hypothetical protein [Mycobacterium sp.]